MVSDGKENTRKEYSVRGRVVEELIRVMERIGLKADRGDIHLEQPSDPSHGDLSCNIALVCAKALGRKPRQLAEEIVTNVSFEEDFIDTVEVAGPGFINFTFSHAYLVNQVVEINKLGYAYGNSRIGAQQASWQTTGHVDLFRRRVWKLAMAHGTFSWLAVVYDVGALRLGYAARDGENLCFMRKAFLPTAPRPRLLHDAPSNALEQARICPPNAG